MWIKFQIGLLLAFKAYLISSETVPPLKFLKTLNQIEELSLTGQLEEAKTLSEKFLSDCSLPQDVSLYLTHKTLWILYQTKQYEKLINRVEKSEKKDPFSLIVLAKAFLELNKENEAESTLQELFNDNINDPQTLSEAGNIRLLQGKGLLAKQLYKEAINHTSECQIKQLLTLKTGLLGVMEKDADVIDEALGYFQNESVDNQLFASALLYLSAKKEIIAKNNTKALALFSELLEKDLPSGLLNALFSDFDHLLFSLDIQNLSQNEKESHFQKSLSLIKKIFENGCTETGWLALGKVYLALCMNSLPIKNKEELAQVIFELKKIKTPESSTISFILGAESASEFSAKEATYQTLDHYSEYPFFEEACFFRIQNLLKWGTCLNQKGFVKEGAIHLKKAANFLDSFLKAQIFKKFKNSVTLLYLNLLLINSEPEKAEHWLGQIPKTKESETYQALFAFNKQTSQETADILLKKALALKTKSNLPILIATSLFDHGYNKESEALLNNSDLFAEALFLKARIADKEQRGDDKRAILKIFIDSYENHPLIEEALFMLYSVNEYLNGGRTEMKHLEHIAKTRNLSPYLPLVHYMIGLDLKKDRKTPDGKWVRKKSLTQAIDAFRNSYTAFETLSASNLIPTDRIELLQELAHLAKLEQGISNFEIAKESKGVKKELYLQYAKEILTSLSDLKTASELLYKETLIVLAEVLIEMDENESAYGVLSKIITEEKNSSYFLSKAHFLLATILMKKGDYQQALQSIDTALEFSDGFSSEDKLMLSMRKGYCFKHLGKLDEAMAQFSIVVNANAISNLRIDGMFERAALYKDQSRYDLYRKQLEAILKIGGKWQLKARQLLEEFYVPETH